MLQEIIDFIFYGILRLNNESTLVSTINYFIYDSIKILLLLFVMISLIGFVRSYIPHDKIKKWLSKGRFGASNVAASLFGAITPFCSCSSIPLFLSFLKAGVPLGVTFSFLITSPLVNEYLVVLMYGFFGWKITLAYVIAGILIGVISGMILGKMKLEKYLVKDMFKEKSTVKERKFKNLKDRIYYGLSEGKDITKKIWVWVLLGVGAGAAIHNLVPETIIHTIIQKGGPFTVIIAVLIGVPLYGSCAAIVPIAVVLFQKGVPIGTALAFMMAIAGLSFPEAVILRRAMKLKLILIFFGIVTIGIIIIGYLFNFLQPLLG